MTVPEASAFAWIFVVKPPRERPSACPSCPLCARGGDVSAHDRRVEHLDEMGGSTHRRERVEERLEHAGLAQAIEPLPYAVPMTEPLRQRAPSHVLDREEMQRLQEQSVVLGFASSARKAGPKHGEHMRPVFFIHPRRHDVRPPNRSEVYESHQIQAGNRENSTALNSSTRPNFCLRPANVENSSERSRTPKLPSEKTTPDTTFRKSGFTDDATFEAPVLFGEREGGAS